MVALLCEFWEWWVDEKRVDVVYVRDEADVAEAWRLEVKMRCVASHITLVACTKTIFYAYTRSSLRLKKQTFLTISNSLFLHRKDRDVREAREDEQAQGGEKHNVKLSTR